jgi:hypothetical protein
VVVDVQHIAGRRSDSQVGTEVAGEVVGAEAAKVREDQGGGREERGEEVSAKVEKMQTDGGDEVQPTAPGTIFEKQVAVAFSEALPHALRMEVATGNWPETARVHGSCISPPLQTLCIEGRRPFLRIRAGTPRERTGLSHSSLVKALRHAHAAQIPTRLGTC